VFEARMKLSDVRAAIGAVLERMRDRAFSFIRQNRHLVRMPRVDGNTARAAIGAMLERMRDRAFSFIRQNRHLVRMPRVDGNTARAAIGAVLEQMRDRAFSFIRQNRHLVRMPRANGKTVRRVLKAVARVDRSKLEAATGLRCTIGIAIPLAIGLAVHRPLGAAFAAAGALAAGFGAFQGMYRSRAAVMLFATAGMGISVLTATVAGYSIITAVLLIGLWGFCGGLMIALGPAASFAGLQWIIALALVEGFPANTKEAAVRTVLVVAGGLLETLVVCVWPLRRFPAERSSLSSSFRSLAACAARIPGGAIGSAAPPKLIDAYSAAAAQPFASRGQVAAFRALQDQAERIQSSLGALATGRAQLLAAGENSAARILESVASAASSILRMIGAALEEARSPRDPYGTWQRIQALAARLESRLSHPSVLSYVIAVSNVRALLGQLRAAWRLAWIPEGEREKIERGESRLNWTRCVEPISDELRTLFANFTLRSQACQYAGRLAIALMVATILSRVLPVNHPYWVAVTLAIILKPDFDATLERGIARISATILGVGATTLIVAELHPGPAALSLLVLACAWSCYTIYSANYAAYAICVTGYAVLLIAFEGAPPVSIALARSTQAALGCVLALLVYAAWPVSRPENVRVALAELLKAQCQRGTAVLLAYAHSGEYVTSALHESGIAARLARSNAEASVDAMLDGDSQRSLIDPQLALGVLAAARLYALGAMTLQARLDTVSNDPMPALDPLITQLERTLATLAASLRSGSPIARQPSLRDLYTQMTRSFSVWGIAHPESQGAPKRALLVSPHHQALAVKAELVSSETDLMVDAVNTLSLFLSARPKSGLAGSAAEIGLSAKSGRGR
jgi:uncharacterized membrane protein YccC